MSTQFLTDDEIDLDLIRTIDDIKPCENYKTLWLQLSILNTPKINKTSRSAIVPNIDSNRIKFLKSVSVSAVNQTTDNLLYGIVVEYVHNYGIDSEIYIDIPSKNFQPTNHIDDYIDSSVDVKVQSLNRFYYIDNNVAAKTIPKIGGIAIVKVAPDFPNNVSQDPKANKFIGMKDNIFYVPIKKIKNNKPKTNIFANNVENSNTSQPVPSAVPAQTTNNQSGVTASKPSNRPKLLLVDFKCDNASQLSLGYKKGDGYIKIREDIFSDLYTIKNILNSYGIPFSCISQETNLYATNTSDLGRVGLEIKLNSYCGLNINSNSEKDDYYISPDFTQPLGKYYKLKIFGRCRKKSNINTKYKAENRLLDIYDIRQTYNITKPQIIKVFKEVVDITQIFYDLGFKQYNPKIDFYEKSDIDKSFWNVFYKPEKIILDYTYNSLLETVFEKNNENIWTKKERRWNGDRFI